MAGVKWIKIVTDIFDDEKMLLIESLPSADSIMVVWFKLLCLAGKTNNSGVFIFNDRIPYTDEMLASIFRRDVKIVRVALNTFESFGMIEIIDDVITIPNWSKHQTLDAYERQKERDRLKKQKARAEKKALISSKSGDTSGDLSGDASGDVPAIEEEKEEDKEKEREEDIKRVPADEPPSPPPSPPENPEPKPKQKRKPKAAAEVKAEPVSYGSLSPRVVETVDKWLQYKAERREGYTPTGLQALITQIENNVKRSGETAVIELIEYCMSNNWKGIIFEKLKKQPQPQQQPQSPRGGAQNDNIFMDMLNERRGQQ